jgi:putative transposase
MIEKTFGICRLVYNLALETKVRVWKDFNVSLSGFDLQRQLTEMKMAYPWMNEIDSQSLNQCILNTDVAFKRFYNGSGHPKFKKKNGCQSFQSPGNKREVNFEKGVISIPKIYDIRASISRRFKGKIKTITISRTTADKYFASVLVQDAIDLPTKPSINPEYTMGIDLGIKYFATTSDGHFFDPNRYLKNRLHRLKVLQRRASKKKKGSNNRKKANLCVAKIHEKITNQRSDYIHKITTGLIRDNQAETFVIEDLNVSGMLKNHKLAQAIQDVSFGEFVRQMKYKCEWNGKNIIQIGRFEPSSKTCNACGHIKQDLKLSDREWTCERCNGTHDRDLNAAKNIKSIGLLKYSG